MNFLCSDVISTYYSRSEHVDKIVNKYSFMSQIYNIYNK